MQGCYSPEGVDVLIQSHSDEHVEAREKLSENFLEPPKCLR